MKLRFYHNHPINIADALKHRDVSATTKKRLEELLHAGYRPAAALNLFKYDLQMDDPENYIFHSADRSKCPDKQYVYRYVHYKSGKLPVVQLVRRWSPMPKVPGLNAANLICFFLIYFPFSFLIVISLPLHQMYILYTVVLVLCL